MIFSFLFPFLLMFSINVLAMGNNNAPTVTLESIPSSEQLSSSSQLSYLNSSCSDISLGGISVGSLSFLLPSISFSSIGKTHDPLGSLSSLVRNLSSSSIGKTHDPLGSSSSLVRNLSSSSIGKTYDPRMQVPPPELVAAMMQASSEERQRLLKKIFQITF